MNAISSKTRLKAVAPKAAEPSKPKMLIYGAPGVGKTWGALDFPSVYYIDTEGGADLAHYTAKLEASGGVYLGPDQGAQSFDTIIEQVDALSTEKHDFRTLVIDSISKVFNLEITREAERLGDKDQFGASKKPAVGQMRRLIAKLDRLDMNVLLIAHERAEWGQNGKGERVEIGKTFDGWDKLEYELHLALNIVKRGDSRIALVRKSRLAAFPQGSNFPWSFSEFANRYGEGVMRAASVPIVLATIEQVSEAEKLLAAVKMEDGWIEKVLAKANAEMLAELTADQITAIIEMMKKRISA